MRPNVGVHSVHAVLSRHQLKSQIKADTQALLPADDYKGRIRHSCIYLVFIGFYCGAGLRYLTDPNVYYMKRNIEDQFMSVEFKEEHSPTTGKTFRDVATVDELYQWLQGPFLSALFATTSDHNQRPGYFLQNNRIIGAVMISQLRASKRDCTDSVPPALQNYTWFCYHAENKHYGVKGYFDETKESKDYFGRYCSWKPAGSRSTVEYHRDIAVKCMAESQGKMADCTPLPWDSDGGWVVNSTQSNGGCHGPFPYEGIDGHTAAPINVASPSKINQSWWQTMRTASGRMKSVAERRGQLMTAFTTKLFNVYPVGAFGVLLNPSRPLSKSDSQHIVRNLKLSRYIDLQTKALFVELAIYNPMLDHVAAVKLVAEMTKSGGLMTSAEVDVVRLWENVTAADKLFYTLTFVLLGFYVYFIQFLIHKWQKLVALHGRKRGSVSFWSDFSTWLQLANICLFFAGMGCSLYAVQLIPPAIDIATDRFIDFGPAVRFMNLATAVKATNAFINWSTLISVLSYSPVFAVMTMTVASSYQATKSFMIIFAIVFFGFAQAYCLVFVGELEEFRSIGNTMLTMTRMLLGDFDFLAMQGSNKVIGPILFFVFVVLAVFVVLMMLVAIISDKYEDTKRTILNSTTQNKGALNDLKLYAAEFGRYIPCIRRLMGDQSLGDYARLVALREAQARGEQLTPLEEFQLKKAFKEKKKFLPRKASVPKIFATDVHKELRELEKTGYVPWTPACPPPPPISQHPDSETIYLELENREHSITVVQSKVRQLQAKLRVTQIRVNRGLAPMYKWSEVTHVTAVDEATKEGVTRNKRSLRTHDETTKKEEGRNVVARSPELPKPLPLKRNDVVAWSPGLPQPPPLEFHPEEHLVKAELRKRAKYALLIQTKMRQRYRRHRLIVSRKHEMAQQLAAVLIQSKVRQREVQISYMGRRVRQAIRRHKIGRRLVLRQREPNSSLNSAPPPIGPPITSAMSYWIDTLADNQIRLDCLCEDMRMLQDELDDSRSTLRAGLGKMREVVLRQLGDKNASSSDIENFGNLLTIDTIRMRAPWLSPLAHGKGVQVVDAMRMEAVSERWLYDPWSGQSLVSGIKSLEEAKYGTDAKN